MKRLAGVGVARHDEASSLRTPQGGGHRRDTVPGMSNTPLMGTGMPAAAATLPTRPRLPGWARVLLVMVCLPLPLLSVFVYVLPLFGLMAANVEIPTWVGQTYNVGLSFGAAATGVLLVWLLMTYVDRRPLREAGVVFTAHSAPLWLLGLVSTTVVSVGAGLTLAQTGLLRDGPASDPSVYGALSVLAMGLVAQGLPEELLWRGYLLQTLRERPTFAVLVSAGMFGLMHLVSQGGQQNLLERLVYVAQAGAFGLLAGVLAVRLQSVWPAVGVHGGIHVGNYLGGLLGVGEGPALWATQAVLYLALAGTIHYFGRDAFRRPIVLDR